MSRYKTPSRQSVAERAFPYRVDLTEKQSCGQRLNEIYAWIDAHAQPGQSETGGYRERQPAGPPLDFVRFYFLDLQVAEAFVAQWGGTVTTVEINPGVARVLLRKPQVPPSSPQPYPADGAKHGASNPSSCDGPAPEALLLDAPTHPDGNATGSPPLTLAQVTDRGGKLHAKCLRCHHAVQLDHYPIIEKLGGDFPYDGLAVKLRCERCQARGRDGRIKVSVLVPRQLARRRGLA